LLLRAGRYDPPRIVEAEFVISARMDMAQSCVEWHFDAVDGARSAASKKCHRAVHAMSSVDGSRVARANAARLGLTPLQKSSGGKPPAEVVPSLDHVHRLIADDPFEDVGG
jgi:hypothetical protein